MPKDYIKFISDLTYYLEKDLKFIYRNQSKYRLFKFNDQNLCTREDIEAFDLLNLKHKVCFTVQSFPKLHSCVQIKSVQDKDFVPYYYEPIGKTSDFNVTEFINNMVRND